VDEGNERDLARHGISPSEVYEMGNSPGWVPKIRYHAGDWKMLGQTHGGRPLTIVIRFYPDRGVLRAITGWRTTRGERSRYFNGR
jgi:hypothetical protein